MMRKQLFAVTIAVLLVLSVFSVLQLWQIKPVQATTIFSDGYECPPNTAPSTFTAWTGVRDGPQTIQSVVKNSGTYAMKAACAAGYAVLGSYIEWTPVATVFIRTYVQYSLIGSANFGVLGGKETPDYADCFSVTMNSTTLLLTESKPASKELGYTSTFLVDTWYCIEVEYVQASSNGGYRVWLDGTLRIDDLTLNTNAYSLYRADFAIYDHGYTWNAYWDDVVIATSYIGPIAGDTTAPTFEAITSNTTITGNDVQISCTVSDETELSAWGFAWNNTGAWVNASEIAVSGLSVAALYNGTLNDTVGNVVSTQFWANDSTNNAAYSTVQSFTVTPSDTLPSGGMKSAYEYVFVNATATYEVNSTDYVCSVGSSLTILNSVLTNVSGFHGSVFVYAGTYQIDGEIHFPSNVNMTLQDGVYINETDGAVGWGYPWGTGSYIIYMREISNSSIYANSNATIHGSGKAGYDYENGIRLESCDNITISASQPNGLKIFNIGAIWIYGSYVSNSTFQNLYGYQWERMGLYYAMGAAFEGLQNVQIINMTSDGGGAGSYSRCPLMIGGWGTSSNNINITGGLFENGMKDNGIYLGGWNFPITNVIMTNVTTYNNTDPGHAGIKFRPACNVTITGWNSTGDYNGIEVGTTMDGEVSTYLDGGSWYNNVSGTINSPLGVGLILYIDDSGYESVRYNTFNLTVLDSSGGSCWVDNSGRSANNQITYNTIDLTSTGADTNAIGISGDCNISQNVFYGTFVDNGQDGGRCDIDLGNNAALHHNTFNIYSTTGNPAGLYNFVNGTYSNYVYYPYSYSGPPPVLVTITITSPTNTTYSSSSITVTLSAQCSGSTIDKIWWNCKNGTSWIYVSNQTYTSSTSMTGICSGSQYTFYAFANATDGTEEYQTVMFTETFVSGTVTITIASPTSIIYTVTTVPVQFTATSTGGTIDQKWWNILVGTSTWLTSYNLTYSGVTSVNNLANGDYTFYAWANDTSGNKGTSTETFTVNVASQGGGGGGGGGGGTQTTIPPANTNPTNNTTNGTGTPVSGFSITNWDWRHLTPVQGIAVLAAIGVVGFVLVNQSSSRGKKKPKWKQPSFWT